MNQFTTLSAPFDHLLSPELVQSVVETHDYAEVSRKFSVRDLLDFLMASSLEKWDGYRDGADRMASLSLRPVHYSTISKKAADVPYEVAKDLFHQAWSAAVTGRKNGQRR